MATIILPSGTIAENMKGPVRVGTLGIQDRPGEAFVFTLAEHPVFEIIAIDENGTVTYDLFVKSGVSFDYEAGPRQFALSIAVTDGQGIPVETDPIVVDITDVNEAPTDIVVTAEPIPDNADLGTPVATLEAEDPDEGQEFTYAFVTDATGMTETDHDLFEIGVGSNQILVKGQLTVATHNLWVKVTDSGDPARSYVKQITLTVMEANEPPEVAFEMAEVAEGAAGGTVVGALTVSDPDQSGMLGYSLVETGEDGIERPSTMFRIDESGNVVVIEGVKLLKTNGADPSFTVKAFDGVNTVYETYEVVLGENQEPTVSFDSELELPKTLPGGTFLGTIMADDPEGDEVTYTPVGGSGSLIRIDGSGNVYVLDGAELSYGDPGHRSFTVEWFDGINRHTESFSLDFVNEAPTVTLIPQAVAEGNPLSRVVGKLSAEDPEGEGLTYELVGDNAELFDLVQTNTGYDIVLQSGIVLDYENEDHQFLSVDVEVSDTVNTVMETLTVELEDVNEAPAVTFAARRINEGAKSGTVVGKLNAADPEGDEVGYELSSTSVKYFRLAENDAGGYDVVVRSGVTLDYETFNHRSFRVTVSDGENEVSRTLALNLADRIDRVTGSQRRDTLKGASGSDVIRGLGGDDTLIAYAGNDTLHGGSGKDILSGGTGRDVFVFDGKPNKRTNLDKVTDFDVKDDSIRLDNKVFTKLGKAGAASKPAALKKGCFATDRAKDKNDYLVYDSKTGVLSYDADGSGFKSTAVKIAQLKKGLDLTYKDLFII
jgi:Ca2+-binding RTX toxin-like protein